MGEHEEQQQEAFLPVSLEGKGVGGQGPEPDQSHRLQKAASLPLPDLDHSGLQVGGGWGGMICPNCLPLLPVLPIGLGIREPR